MAVNKNKIYFEFGNLTDTGRIKEHNKNASIDFKINNGHGFVVCKGIDGKEGGGAIASKIAVNSIKQYFVNKNFTDISKALTNAIIFANYEIYNQAQKNFKYNEMGTSIVIVIFVKDKIYYAYVGNSRLYVLRNNNLQRLTKDHTIVQNLIDKGEIAENETKNHPDKNQLLNTLGLKKEVKFGICKQAIKIENEDLILLCSDGLTNMMNDDEILEIIKDKNTSVKHKALNLINQANSNGGEDNTTVQLIRFFDSSSQQHIELDENNKFSKKSYTKYIVGVIITIVLVLSGYFIYDNLFSNKNESQITSMLKTNNNNKLLVSNINTKTKKNPVSIVTTKTSEKKIIKKNDETKKKSEPFRLTYNLQKGDNFYRLGIRFNLTVSELEEINSIKAIHLRAHQKVIIPLTAVHTIKNGETLSTLSTKYNIKQSLIIKANRLTNDKNLKVGKKLYIPLHK
ncbi:MAG: LysM peptidoglycan-binding domain-containing protein [Bacteroidales bacterium]|nr:LysM peptidoglycan-binding domain-containing protein [Bacteroidales bacterium]